MDASRINPVEVIEHTRPLKEGGGHAFVFREQNANATLAIQDDGRTLKAFIQPAKSQIAS